ncbi:MAG: ABC transporter permease [Carbonactinosporaceae bacterium]
MAKTGGSLRSYLLTRLALVLPMVLILLTMVFVLMRVAPGDPVQAALGGHLSQEMLDARRHAAGFDRPLIVQYLEYLRDVFTGDFGRTLTDNRAVADILVTNGGATLTLTVAALLVALCLGVPLGLFAGRFRDSSPDGALRVFGILTYAAPVFFVGLLFQLVFGVYLGWLPTSQQSSPTTFVEERTHILLVDTLLVGDTSGFVDALEHLVLPAATLGLLVTGIFLRLVRVNVMQALQGDYIEAARARGLPESSVVYRHAFRNALVPVVTIMGLQAALLLSGSLLTESTFDWPGLGSQLINYLNNRDYSAVQGIITVYALIVVAVSVIIDFVNALIDPRVRYS